MSNNLDSCERTNYILFVVCTDRVGGRTVTTEIPSAGGVDHWDFGGQWVGR